MCNLSQGLIEEGRVEGRVEGQDQMKALIKAMTAADADINQALEATAEELQSLYEKYGIASS